MLSPVVTISLVVEDKDVKDGCEAISIHESADMVSETCGSRERGLVLPSEPTARVLAATALEGEQFDLSRSVLCEPDGSVGDGLILEKSKPGVRSG